MAYLTVTRISGDPDSLLRGYAMSSGVMTDVGRDHGLVLHAAAKAEDGLLVLNIWPSKDGSEAAARDWRRNAVIEHHGLDPDQIRREHHELATCVLLD